VRLRQRTVQRQRLLGSLARERERAIRRGRAVDGKESQRVGETGVRTRERRVAIDRLAEVFGRAVEGIVAALMPEVAAAQVQVVRREVFRPGRDRAGGQTFLAVRRRRERDAKRAGDASRDVVLHLEDILHLALVRAPQSAKVRRWRS
jgi:hypothetical protein